MRRSPAQEPRDREEQEQAGQNGSCDHHQDVRIIEVSGRDHHGPGNISLCRSEPEHGAAFRTAEQKSHGKGSRDEQDRSRYRTTPHYPDQVMEIGAEGGENHHHEGDSRQLAADRDQPRGPARGERFHNQTQHDGNDQRGEERQADRENTGGEIGEAAQRRMGHSQWHVEWEEEDRDWD